MVKNASSINPGPAGKRLLILGAVIGLAVLTKEGTLALIPLALGTIFITGWQRAKPKLAASTTPAGWWSHLGHLGWQAAVEFLILLLPVFLIAGWWYWRNIQLYGDWLGWNAFIAVLGQRAHPASLSQLWSERWGFMLSFWGLFGGVNLPMWTWIYHLLNALVILAVPGFLFYFLRRMGQWWAAYPRRERGSSSWSPAMILTQLFDFVADFFPLVVTLLLTMAVVFGLVQWATTTWSSQGRLVFTAISAVHLLFVIGLLGNLPPRWAQKGAIGLGGFMFLIAIAAPLLWIRPNYQPGQYSAHWRQPTPLNHNFNDQIKLVGMEIGRTPGQPNETYQPGELVDLMLSWEVLAPMDRNWSVFVHLNDPVLGVPITQRDMFLAQGLRPTSLLNTGEKVFNYYQLRIPETAIAPTQLELTTGLYDFNTFERLPLVAGGDLVTLAQLPLRAVPGTVPNPLQVEFENGLTLVGFELEPRRAAAAELVQLTLYWRAAKMVAVDYTLFAQVVSTDTTRWGAQDLPVRTSLWSAGELQAVTMEFPLRDDVPAGVYPLIIGLYTINDEGQFNRLQRLAADGRPTDDFLQLTLLRVE
jgi:hypothetical protein